MSRWHSCNVLRAAADRRQLWQFDARNGQFVLQREHTGAADQPLPAPLVQKTWRALWQPRLNVAWLPPENVFLRVVHLPKADFAETLGMVELQLEKLSPIPLTQVVWSIQPFPQSAGELQTVVVLFAERKVVEEFLGQLEQTGYLADRLELPALDLLAAIPARQDGAWIFPEALGGHRNALVAWWYGGTLQNLNLISLPVEGDPATAVREQLLQIAWAGELEGWLTSPPTWHLVAERELAAEWEPPLRQGLDAPIEVIAPPSTAEVAALTAQRAANAEPKSNLLPHEFATRYQQQFVDRLWMRGLAAVVGVYLVGVLIYMLALGALYWKTRSVENKVASLANTYTNAIQLKARYQVLKDRQELKFAALDCWKAVADVLPESLTLDSFKFNDGRRLSLNGTAPGGADKAVLEFYDALRKITVNGQALFDPAKSDPAPRYGAGPGGNLAWNFTLELKRVEVQ
ncbi:MAG: hypothetical protein RMK20_00520 [Verrucomicrobiales bacterium]|nr:hypothetical protein [Verrucomicrobiales bacterium]